MWKSGRKDVPYSVVMVLDMYNFLVHLFINLFIICKVDKKVDANNFVSLVELWKIWIHVQVVIEV